MYVCRLYVKVVISVRCNNTSIKLLTLLTTMCVCYRYFLLFFVLYDDKDNSTLLVIKMFNDKNGIVV